MVGLSIARAAHQDIRNPVCDGSGVVPLAEWGPGICTEPIDIIQGWGSETGRVIQMEKFLVECPGCGEQRSLTRQGRIR